MNQRTKQAVFSTIISYVGVFAGFVSSAILIPKYLFPEQVGLVKLIAATVGLFASVFSLGVQQLLYRSYSQYEHIPIKQDNLLYIALKFTFIGVALAIPFYLFLFDGMLNIKELTPGVEKSFLFITSVFIAISFRIIYNAFFSFIRMKGKVIIDSIIQNIVLKVGILFLITLHIVNLISFSTFIYLHIAIYVLFPLLALLYMWHMGYTPRFKKVQYEKEERKEFYRLTLFGSLAAIGGSLYLFLDTFMVNYFLSEADVGVYGTMFLFGIIVNIPSRNLRNASVAKISSYVSTNSVDELGELYRKSSNHLLLLGGFIFLGVITNLETVYTFLPKEYSNTFYIVFFIGIAQLFDMLTSVNIEIIASSQYYRLNTYFVFLSITVAIIFNLMFIPLYGVNGAALGTFMAVFFNNIVRTLAVGKIFNIYPLNLGTLKCLLIISFSYGLLYIVPQIDNIYLNFLLRVSLLLAFYLPLSYFLKVSKDVNIKIDQMINLLK